MTHDKVHVLAAMLVGFGLGCTLIHATGKQPLAVMRPSVEMSALQLRPSLASQSKFMAPMHQRGAGYSMQPVRAAMPQQEEYAAASVESGTKQGRREIMANFGRAAALGAAVVATTDRAAFADEEEEEEVPKPGAGKRFKAPKLGALAAVPAIAVGWAGFNILGPAFDQLGYMQEEKERKVGGGGKKRR